MKGSTLEVGLGELWQANTGTVIVSQSEFYHLEETTDR